jgi:serine/threonine protein kinase
MLAAGLVEALASVHRAGIAHLDLKPANVLLTHDGPRLIDFGIAAELGVVPPDRSGSKGYMAPERLAGVAADAASDVFALGATLAYACSGCPAELQGVIKDCMRPDASTRPTLAELTDRLAAIAPDNPLWLPTPVQAQIDRLAAEAANPPQAAPIPANPRRLLLWSAGALAVLVLGGLAIGLRPPHPASPADAAPTRTPASSAANPPPSKPALRTVEFYAYGRTTVKVLTTTINGHALTVHDVRLPYRRTLQLAPWQGPGSWSIEYTTSAGQFRCVMLVDGKPAANANGSSTGGDMHYEEHGEFTL